MTKSSEDTIITKDQAGLALLRARQPVCQSFTPQIGVDGHVVTDHQAMLECQGDRWLITGPAGRYRTGLEQSLLGYLVHIQGSLPDHVTAVEAVETVRDNIFS